MKIMIMLVLAASFVYASEQITLVNMKIISTSTRTNPGKGNENVCWVVVSDGTTVYQAYQEKYGFGFVSCPVISLGSVVKGGVSRDQQYLLLEIPKGRKTKSQTYHVTDMQAAQ